MPIPIHCAACEKFAEFYIEMRVLSLAFQSHVASTELIPVCMEHVEDPGPLLGIRLTISGPS